jgi:non-ribosomal peptide synthetase component F
MTCSSRVLQFASYNFDVANFEILTTLIVGATICVPTEHGRINSLATAINELRVNYAGATATLAKILNPLDVPNLKVLVLAGEANTQHVIQPWMSRLDVVNGYGPSEASCFFSANIYTRQSSEANNIGQAFKNVYAGHVVNP